MTKKEDACKLLKKRCQFELCKMLKEKKQRKYNKKGCPFKKGEFKFKISLGVFKPPKDSSLYTFVQWTSTLMVEIHVKITTSKYYTEFDYKTPIKL